MAVSPDLLPITAVAVGIVGRQVQLAGRALLTLALGLAAAGGAAAAGMLALETRASSGVGVAISVTTIPAVGYLGVAVGLGDISKAAGTLAVLGANVAMMTLGAVATLLLQRALLNRASAKRNRTRPH